jgi:hypothetical protein
MKEALSMMTEGRLNPSIMVTHIGGLDAVIDTTMRLPEIPGGKKLIYTNISMELTAIEDFSRKGEKDPFFKKLNSIVKKNEGIWCGEAEDYVLKHGTPI